MNMAQLVITTKHFLSDGKYNPEIINASYIGNIKYIFQEEKKLFGLRRKRERVTSTLAWLNQLKEKNIEDIKLLAKDVVNDINLTAFSNGLDCIIVCFYNNRVTYWTKKWSFDKEKKHWNIKYTEEFYPNPHNGKPKFEDRTKNFAETLKSIKGLAEEIDCNNFANCFQKALDCLLSEVEISKILPSKNQRLFDSAQYAAVFGGMGSWNDSPPYMAQKKGLREEYDTLTNQLYREIMLACMYAVNEW